MNEAHPFFAAIHLSAGYGRQPVLRDISFTLEQGCLAGVLGANGCGKTTLLKAICGILPHAGRCTLQETCLEQLTPRQLARRCGYIPQRSGISIDLSVLEVVLMGFNPQLGLLEHPTPAMREKARRALALTGLAHREKDNYLQLSEGQKQLCILARTLAADSQLLLLDEPESALDFRHRYRILDLLRTWAGKGNGSALVALHDPLLALNCCDQLLVLSDGWVQACLTPGKDALPRIERELAAIYGPVSLQYCTGRNGQRQIVLLKEPD
ncbi:ABC transporter ATP-binding protein [uncultured Gemmiger sp.]|uniref:ABC transporter ATP-binding protein n=1 Tax=uncultured Gemmiger sp. TaxID=1623490 RepID=UPI0025D30581|nr:ABC transporter ATP-binding protein [uncultured Gemmiger sp.]